MIAKFRSKQSMIYSMIPRALTKKCFAASKLPPYSAPASRYEYLRASVITKREREQREREREREREVKIKDMHLYTRQS